jgi:DNA-binding transcriptional LysR family regulator
VTQAAVSRQIKLLEQDLNLPLFVRAHRKVLLTPAGEVLAAAVAGAFVRMTDAIEFLRQPQLPNTVVVGATLAFSHFWLLPRLPAFRAAHPWVNLRLVAEDATLDARRDRFDVMIRYGTPPFPDSRSLASCSEEVFPVCNPAFREKHAAQIDAGRMLSLPLIGLDWVEPSWLKWTAWTVKTGLGPAATPSSLSFNHYIDAIHAALNGEGVALGWAALVSHLLTEGRLVRLGDRSVVPAEQHHVLLPATRAPSDATTAFVDWISRQFRDQAP